VAKCNAAAEVDIRRVIESANELASSAKVIRAQSVVTLDEPAAVAGKRVIVVDDGPTLTHGGMAYGAGYVAATQAGAGEIVDPRKSAVGDILRVFQAFPHIGKVLPAMGYSPSELADLAETINKSAAEVVVAGTPTDLAHVARLRKPVVRTRYDYAERQEPGLDAVIDEFLRARGLRKSSIGE
jgi:predicted GTPase